RGAEPLLPRAHAYGYGLRHSAGRFAEQRLNERAVGVRVPLGGADHLLPDHAVAPDDERLRHAGGLIARLDGPGFVVQDLERQAVLAREVTNGLLVTGIVDADRDDPEPVRPERALELLDARHLDAAWRAPRCPDVEQDHLAAIISERACPGRRGDGLCVEVGRARTHRHGEELVAHDAGGREQHAASHEHEQSHDGPLLPDRHAVSMQRSLSAAISAFGSGAPNTACPATTASAPARHTDVIVSRLIPPSTSRTAWLPAASSSARACRNLASECAMNDWPPNPGFTDMMSSRSRSDATSRTISSGMDGFTATPARQPNSLMRQIWRCRWGATSACSVSVAAPAAANVSKYRSGSMTIMCTSSGSSVIPRSVSITLAPNVRLGTKRPSITSTCTQSAPADSIIVMSLARCAKSALRIDGAMRIVMVGRKW